MTRDTAHGIVPHLVHGVRCMAGEQGEARLMPGGAALQRGGRARAISATQQVCQPTARALRRPREPSCKLMHESAADGRACARLTAPAALC